jgi:hypothetical protein
MILIEKMDEYGRAAWIAALILAFWAFWPLGLASLAFLLLSGRLSACSPHGAVRWHHAGRWYNSHSSGRMGGGWCGGRARWGRAPASGNTAFDEYRAETLRRLEEEQQEFQAFLERLRRARDKAEFDQFMAERRNRPQQPEPPPSEG